jgi:hypothetical protein
MSPILALTVLVFASGICILIVGMMRAPFGHEDENGFHAMRPVKAARPTPATLALPVHIHEMSGQV